MTQIPELPWAVKPATDPDRLGWLYLFGLAVFGVSNAVDRVTGGQLSWFEAIPLQVLAFSPLLVIEHLCLRVILDHDSLRIRGLLTDRIIAWSRVKDISLRSEDTVVIELGDRSRSLGFDGQHGRPSSGQVAEVMRTLRTQALEPGPAGSVRISWGAYASAAYIMCLWAAMGYLLT